MPAIGLLVLFAGAFLISSALSNRNPKETLLNIVRDPSNARKTLNESKGTGYASTYKAETGDGSYGQGLGVQTPGAAGSTPAAPAASGAAAGAVAFVRSQIGKPYRFGATGPNSWDCSALMQAAYASQGVKIPRNTAAQISVGRAVSQKQLAPGDLLFTAPGHVTMYVGPGKRIIDAPRTGSKVSERDYWTFFAARRVV